MKSPTERVLKYLKTRGFTVGITEHWSQFGGAQKPDGSFIGRRNDLFGFIDMIALKDEQTIAIQCTAVSGMLSRYKKILGQEKIDPKFDDKKMNKAMDAARKRRAAARACLKAGWRIVIYGHDKGMKVPKMREVTSNDFVDQVALKL